MAVEEVQGIDYFFYEQNQNAPVSITEQEIKASEANRAKKQRTVRQLPVFRDSANLAFVISQVLLKCPTKLKCTLDEMERLSSQLLQLLDLANENIRDRHLYCAEAHSVIITLTVRFEILQRLGAISKDTTRKIKRLCHSITAQIAGWRRSACGEGHIQNPSLNSKCM